MSIYAATGLIAAVCAGAFLMVLVKVAIKESRRITKQPIQLEMPAEPKKTEEDEHGFKEGAAYTATPV